MVGLGQVNIGSTQELLLHKGQSGFSNRKKSIWQAVIWSALYIIWSHRNSIVFKSRTDVVPDMFGEIQVRAFEWVYARTKKDLLNWDDWKKVYCGGVIDGQ